MKSIRIGKLIFNRKAISFIAFCLFLNGVLIGSEVASNQDSNSPFPIVLQML